MQIEEHILTRYKVDEPMLDGGQANLAKGVDLTNKQYVVIKQLNADPLKPHYDRELARFQKVAELRFEHPLIVDPIDFGSDQNEWYMIMPWIEGPTLEQYVRDNQGSLDLEDALDVVHQIAEALIVVHARKIVHRDIKPSNILVDLQGNCKLIDFGICLDLNQPPEPPGEGILGTQPWLPPEQVYCPGNEQPTADLYSLGAVFYYLLTGESPAQGRNVGEVLIYICRQMPPSPRQLNPNVPEPIDHICMKLLAKQPEDRIQTAEELRRILDHPEELTVEVLGCPACGQTARAGIRFCSLCGNQLTDLAVIGVRCLACGHPVGNANACPHCKRFFGQVNHRLAFKTGLSQKRIFRIPEGVYEIGRDQLDPQDRYLSKRHARIVCDNGSVCVQDVGSTNKTYVGGQLAESAIQLSSHCELQIADQWATFIST